MRLAAVVEAAAIGTGGARRRPPRARSGGGRSVGRSVSRGAALRDGAWRLMTTR